MARILLIENDPGFAASLARVLGATGYETEVVAEGREGLTRAAAWRPDGIVLCVELPDMSGYLVCQRLKKDEALKAVPLVLTSADATEKSFADHQKLKVRADAYLLKPFPPQTLLESLAHLVGAPERQTTDEEELVRLEDGADEAVPALDLDALGDETPHAGAPAPGAAPRDEDDLFLDSLMGLGDEHPAGGAAAAVPAGEHADESLSGSGLELDLDSELGDPGPLDQDQPVGADDLDAAADSLPDDSQDPMAELEALRRDDDPADRELSLDDERTPSDGLPLERPAPAVKPASADLLRAAGIRLLDDEDDAPAPAPAPEPFTLPPPGSTRSMPALNLPKRSTEATQPSATLTSLPVPGASSGLAERLERELAEVREHLSDARAEILSRESEVRQFKDKVAAVTRRAEQAEAEVRDARTEAGEREELRERLAAAERRAEDAAGARAEAEKRAAEAERRTAAAEKAAAEAKAELERRAAADRDAEQKLAALRAELSAARAEFEAARGELAEAKASPASAEATAALEARVAELEAATAKHEDRVVKAYQKIRNDEKVRDKVRKALSIASQLLDEGMVPDPTAERRAAAATPPAPRPLPGPGQS